MTFLNATILFGLIAGAIPIIIHLITRQKAKTVFFSTLRFLQELKNQQIRRLKIRQILLLILRTLIILLLVLTFARPTLKGRLGKGIHATAKTTTVLILDNSLSMGVETGGRQVFDAAKQRVQELEDLFSVGDEVYGVFASTGTPLIFDGAKYDFKTVTKIIQKAKPAQSGTDLVAALMKAKELLQQSSNINKEINLISDLQRSGFRNIENLVLPLMHDQGIKIFLIPIQARQVSNLAITEVTPANQIIEKGKVFELDAIVKNSGTKSERNKLVQIFLDEKRAGQAAANIESGKTQTTKFRVVPQRTGLITGSVLLEDDDLFADNRRYFSFSVPEQTSVLVVGQGEKDVRFLQLALNPEFNPASSIKVDYLAPSRIEFGTLKNYQVVILSNIPRIEGLLLSSLADHVNAGRGLIIFLGNEVDLRSYNENFNQKLSLPLFTETVGEMGARDAFLTLGKFDFSHPIFSDVFDDQKKNVESPQFFFVAKMRIEPQQESVIEFSTGDPFLVESNFGAGKILLFTSAIDPNWSDLYLKGLFVPMMNRCVMYLSGNATKSNQSFLVNQELTANVAGAENIVNFQIEKPDGKSTKIIPQISEGNFKLNFKETELAGIYSLRAGDRVLTKWAVNPDPDESDLTPMDSAELETIIGNDNLIQIQPEQSLASVVSTSRYGRELWKYFIGIALVFLIIEMLLARESGEAINELEHGLDGLS